MKRTKIVCTIGPASEDQKMLRELIKAGMNVARLNFSHGSHAEHASRIKNLRKIREELDIPVAIAMDTKGPEIRLGTFVDHKPVDLKQGDKIILTTKPCEGNAERVHVSYAGLAADVSVGTKILVDDGLVELEVEQVKDNTEIYCRALNYGRISDRKGVNVPGTIIKLPAITEQDRADIMFGIEAGVDMVFASFVRSAADLLEIRHVIEENGGSKVQIFAKIENHQGVQNIDEILDAADGIMVARGDLGVEIPTQEVPLVQKQIIRKANMAGKPVITATQMLDSMQRNPRPTRAEVNDVANAILDGSDAIMLSGETAAGRYPREAVLTMSDIAETTEASPDFKRGVIMKERWATVDVSSSISRSTCLIASQIKADAIVAATSSGFTARQISKYRPYVPIIAVTPEEIVYNQLSIVWGVTPMKAEVFTETDQLVESSILAALKSKLVHEGDQIVLTAGIPSGYGSATNMIKVHTVGDILVTGQGLVGKTVVGKAVLGSTAKELEGRFEDGDVLVAKFASPDLLPFMQKAGAIIVEEGGLTGLAAIFGMQYNIPTVVDTMRASKVIKDGSIITVDSTTGIVYEGVAKVL